MASRDQVYCKFGITAEAAQLFETDLGCLLLAARGMANGWHLQAHPEEARKALDTIDASTLGAMLSNLKRIVSVEDGMADQFSSALKARNSLIHGFYERHNFKIDSDAGRDEMIVDLERLQD